jgi:putative transposase
MVNREHRLSVSRQARLLEISRGSVYYKSRPCPEADLVLMRRMDELHLEYPFMGSRQLQDQLNRRGFHVGRQHVGTLMKRMGMEALYRRPNTSRKHPQHKVYPYLLRGLKIDRANHVWATDISYIPMAKGFVYLCAVVDWASRKVLSHRISITLDTAFCMEALEDAFSKYGQPEYFNTDQGSQFTSFAFTEALKQRGIRISMDGKGCWRDNVFVERIWKSVKYEEVYLKAYNSVSETVQSIAKYFNFYNSGRPHSSLNKLTPDEYYFTTRSPLPAVA